MTSRAPRSTTTRLPRVRASELRGRGWLNTGGKDVALADLRGKVVILDFWTFCCVNCLHVLDELRELEEAHRDELVIIGVHSPKFEHEADPDALAAAVERYEVHHPVLDDPELVTWSAYTARAWPTLVVIDPEGYVVAQMAGEGHASAIAVLVDELVAEHEARGTLHRGSGPYVPPAPTSGTLRFPAKAITLPGGNLLVADAGHHSLAELAPDTETLVRRIGTGERGLVDGTPDVARFSEPNGLCLVPDGLRASLGYDVLVTDTVNHALRGVRLSDGVVTTVAGTGEQFMVGGVENVVFSSGIASGAVVGAAGDGGGGGSTIRSLVPRDLPPDPPRPATTTVPALSSERRLGPFDPRATYEPLEVKLSSPWDVAWSGELGGFVVAMAGNHTLWAFDGGWKIGLLAGTMNEGLEDGRGEDAWFAQPSGLAVAADGAVWVADAETSALRRVDGLRGGVAVVPDGVSVRTAVGQGLFDFGHRDGPTDQALFQHPLGVAVLPDGSVVVADTYDGAIRRVVLDGAASGADVGDDAAGTRLAGEVTTLATGLAEPSDVVVQVVEDADGPAQVHLLVVESTAHRITRVALPADLAGEVLDGGAHRTQRPVTEIAAGALRLDVPFVPAPGQKLDDRFGPSTELRVSATPPELLLAGAGTGTELGRDLAIDPAVTEGVLHVTARAASCDVVPLGPDGRPDPDVFPACHLAQQDWGVPVRVVAGDGTPGAVPELTLPLRG
ncbi:NHL domain-containing thioredoxin family protein [Cellulosimicrobium sp. Marseille-Q4280]|uniref:NHL domain-containing thioredoxin family protein n=1 Tax=Cellulosimicrobium sp. Marseille-Q4280 TaxID=2937992 RepID=UPI00203E49B5|nr:NHL domain-containing thioredoxin family protein [Cellulosimicrobium sp. Marseille-Q4280]